MTSVGLKNCDLYISGRCQAPEGRHYFDRDNPFTGEVWARVAGGTDGTDVAKAAAPARDALPVWNSLKPSKRGELTLKMAAGNNVVTKPSAFTSASKPEFAELFAQAGFPPGVENVITGFGSEAGALELGGWVQTKTVLLCGTPDTNQPFVTRD